MDREKVIVMTDEELWIKAAELAGWTGINVLDCGIFGYFNDIAAAWELVDKFLELPGSDVDLCRDVDRKEWCCVFSLWEESPRSMGMKNAGWFQGEDKNVKRAITRAFILAMTKEDK